MNEPLYVARAGGLGWLRLLIVAEAVFIVVAVAALVLDSSNALAWLTTLVIFALTFALIFAILPRRYEVWPERLDLIFPFWRWRIPYDTIDGARPARWWEPYGGVAMRFATYPGQAIVVERKQPHLTRPNIVISPEDRQELLLRLQASLTRYHGRDA